MPQFELGRRLFPTNRRDGLAWHMLARFNQSLDVNLCADLKRADPVRRVLRNYGLSVGKEEMVLWADAIDDSLALADRHGIERRGKQPPWWICAPGEVSPPEERLLPPEDRVTKREAVWTARVMRERNTSTEIRLNVNLNPDRYHLRKLQEEFWRGKINSDGDHITERYFSAAWIDNDNLLFGGYRELQKLGRPDRYDAIFRWDLETGDITKYAESGFGICFFKGFISYYVTRDGKLFYREGELRKEKEVELSPEETKRIRPGLSRTNARFQCRRFDDSASPHAPPIWKLESGGKIERIGGFEDKMRGVRYYPSNSQRPIEFDPYEGLKLRVGTAYWTQYPPKYSAYLDASWLPVIRGRAAPEPIPIWILSSDGGVNRYDVPAGPWAGSIYGPAKGGWFALTGAGLYFLTDARSVKILAGRAQAIRVSPNGCRAAVSTPLGDGKGDPLWVVDICRKGDKP